MGIGAGGVLGVDVNEQKCTQGKVASTKSSQQHLLTMRTLPIKYDKRGEVDNKKKVLTNGNTKSKKKNNKGSEKQTKKTAEWILLRFCSQNFRSDQSSIFRSDPNNKGIFHLLSLVYLGRQPWRTMCVLAEIVCYDPHPHPLSLSTPPYICVCFFSVLFFSFFNVMQLRSLENIASCHAPSSLFA